MNCRLAGRALLVLSILLTTACSSQPAEEAKPADSKYGFVLFSLTRDPGGDPGTDAVVYLDGGKLGGIIGHVGVKTYHSTLRPNGGLSPDEGDFGGNAMGHVYLVALPEGDHAFTEWQIVSDGTRFSPQDRPPPLPFHVVAGRIRYLGNLHCELLNVQKARTGSRVTADPIMLISDEHMRDIEAATMRRPFDTKKLDIAPFGSGRWLSSYEFKASTNTQEAPLRTPSLPPH